MTILSFSRQPSIGFGFSMGIGQGSAGLLTDTEDARSPFSKLWYPSDTSMKALFFAALAT